MRRERPLYRGASGPRSVKMARLFYRIGKEWRSLFILMLIAAAIGIAWFFELKTARHLCKAAEDLRAGQFLIASDLQGNNTQAFAGKFLRFAKSKGETIESDEVCAPDPARAVIADRIAKRQFVPGIFGPGVCLDAWNVKDSKILASDLRIVALTVSSEEALVYFSMLRAQESSVDFTDADKIRFAVVTCKPQDPCTRPRPAQTPTASTPAGHQPDAGIPAPLR